MGQTRTLICALGFCCSYSQHRCRNHLILIIFHNILIVFSAISFLIYGSAYFFSKKMKVEFKRFGLEKFGCLTGCLEIGGGIGLIFGLWVPTLLILSSLGLFLLMVLGFGVRLKMRDGLALTFPSFFYMLLNLYIFYFTGLSDF
ncbi:MAG: DoxX family protein [Flammeovirgaceae bacterium]|nr:DoxX family protein [Flammeovirgaceae bacterium]